MPVIVATRTDEGCVSTDTPQGRFVLAEEAVRRLKAWGERYVCILDPKSRKLHALMQDVERTAEKERVKERP